MSYDCQWDRTPKARKDHTCDVCGCTIPRGETYHKQSGIYDRHPYTWKVHQQCAALYWHLNKDAYDREEILEISDFEWCEVEAARGLFPHAVCNLERKVFAEVDA